MSVLLDVPDSIEVPNTSRGLERLEEIAARRDAMPHVVAAVKFGAHRLVTCKCGATFDGRGRRRGLEVRSNTDEMLDYEFRQHAAHHRRQVAEVEVVEP